MKRTSLSLFAVLVIVGSLSNQQLTAAQQPAPRSHDVLLQPEDVIYYPPVGPQAAIGGQVNTPAVYELKGETTLSDLFTLAGGLTNTAYGGKVFVEEILNRNARRVEEVTLDSAGLAHPLKDGDLVNVTSLSPRLENAITLRGNVASPGRYPWHEGMRIGDLIPSREFLVTYYWKQQNQLTLESQVPGARRSGAQSEVRRNAPDINWDYAVVQRMDPEDLSTRLIPFNLGKAILEHDSANNIALQPGDIVTIFSQSDLRVPELKQTKFVRLTGEFGAPGVYRVKAGEHLRELVREAGGLTPSAYLYGSQFSRQSVRAEQQRRLDQLIAESERDLNRRSAQILATSTSNCGTGLRARQSRGRTRQPGSSATHSARWPHCLEHAPDRMTSPLRRRWRQFNVPQRPRATVTADSGCLIRERLYGRVAAGASICMRRTTTCGMK